MLNSVTPAPNEAQLLQSAKAIKGPNLANKPESTQFNTVLAREVADKRADTPHKKDAKKTAPDDTDNKPVDTVSNKPAEKQNEKADSDTTPVAKDTTSQPTTEQDTKTVQNSQKQETQTDQSPTPIMNREGNTTLEIPPSNTELVDAALLITQAGIGKALEATTQTTPQTGMIDKNINVTLDANAMIATDILPAGLGDKNPGVTLSAGLATPAPLQSLHDSAHQSSSNHFKGDSGNSLWLALQAANTGYQSKPGAFVADTQTDILGQMGDTTPGFAPQGDFDLLQPQGQSGLSSPNSLGSSLNGLTPTASHTLQHATTAQPIDLNTPLGHSKWNNDFAQKIVWLAHQQNQVAELRLNPAHLGPVEIMLSLSGDDNAQATAQFVSPHIAVREVIEAALPRLREMMAESGIQLGDVMVGAESFQQQEHNEPQGQQQAKNTAIAAASDELTVNVEKTVTTGKHNGVVNTFA